MAPLIAGKKTRSKLGMTTGTSRQNGSGRTAWLIAVGVVAGVAGGVFALRMLAPLGDNEPDRRRKSGPNAASRLEASQPQEILVPEEPVEISTRMRPGEWTEESLQAHIEEYRQQIRDMGAAESQIVTDVDRTEEGAVRVAVSWDRSRA